MNRAKIDNEGWEFYDPEDGKAVINVSNARGVPIETMTRADGKIGVRLDKKRMKPRKETPSSNVVPDDIAKSIDEWINDGAKPIESSIPNLLGVAGCGISDLRKSAGK